MFTSSQKCQNKYQKIMKTYESLKKEVSIPASIGCTYSISTIKSLPLHMHHAYEVIFLLEGSAELTCTSFNYHLKEGDVFIANVNELHSIHSESEKNLILTFQFNPYVYSDTFPHLSYYWFFCDSYLDNEKKGTQLKSFQNMLFKIAHMLSTFEKGSSEINSFEIKSFTSDIINFMINNFQNISFYENYSIKKNFKSGDELAMKRIFEIQEYIYLNFTEKISLNDISNHLCLNKYYVSRLIKNFIGLNLTDLIGLIRTEKAEIQLLTTNASIEQISYECGFSSVPYFEKHFIKWNKTKPYEYRKNKLKEISLDTEAIIPVDISDERVESAESRLLSLPVDNRSLIQDYYISVPFDIQGEPFPHSWERYINISDIHTALQLANKISFDECKKELHFDTVRIINIFDSFASSSSKNTFLKAALISFFQKLKQFKLQIEFYFLPSTENINGILEPMQAFLDMMTSNYDNLCEPDFTFVINTIYLKSQKDAATFSVTLKKLFEKYYINDLIITSHHFSSELYVCNSMHLVPQVLYSPFRYSDDSNYINYRELFDIPSKNMHSSAAFSRSGLFGLFGEKKSIYYAWSMLSNLGDSILLHKDGIIVTRNKNDYHILIFDPSNQYSIQKSTGVTNIQFSINVKTSYDYSYNLIEISLDSEFSLFRKLSELQFPDNLTSTDVKYLNIYTSPRISISDFIPKENNIINIGVKPYSAKLLILEQRGI